LFPKTYAVALYVQFNCVSHTGQ